MITIWDAKEATTMRIHRAPMDRTCQHKKTMEEAPSKNSNVGADNLRKKSTVATTIVTTDGKEIIVTG